LFRQTVLPPRWKPPPAKHLRRKKRRNPTGPAGPKVSAVKAPMPGNVLGIRVKPGDKVSFKQTLCSLEAMKMKNAIRSPRDGVIATVNVTEGQAVAHGDVLFTFQ